MTKPAPRRTLNPTMPPASIEKKYFDRLMKLIRRMNTNVTNELKAAYGESEAAIVVASDASMTPLYKRIRELLRKWRSIFVREAAPCAEWFANAIRRYTARGLAQQFKKLKDAGLGFNLEFSYVSQQERRVLKAIVTENVNLIKSIADQYLTEVEGIVLRSIQNGNDMGEMTELLSARYGISERRAAMIARDQTAKATENLSRTRLLDYGVTKGIWMHTSAGKTYRDTHVGEMNGKEYDLAEGLYDPDEKVQRHIHPAELVNCRCVCKPIIPRVGGDAK